MSLSSKEIKQQIFNACEAYVLEKQQNIEGVIASHKNSLASETKSSAGDKHETGRAMLQLEMEKAGQQLAEVQKMKFTLEKVNVQNNSKIAALGSLIKTSKFNYFLAISLGRLSVEGKEYFVVSLDSPIGRQLLGKQPGAQIPFNDSKIIEIL